MRPDLVLSSKHDALSFFDYYARMTGLTRISDSDRRVTPMFKQKPDRSLEVRTVDDAKGLLYHTQAA
jgi:hypothetical protein